MQINLKRNDTSARWFSTGFMVGGVGAVDADKHTLKDAVLIRPGEALGHGVWIDAAFCADIAARGAQAGDKGLKARFGHPNMCSEALGTFLGRWKATRIDEGSFVRGDLHLSSTAAESPKGDLRKYVEEMAAKEPGHFGASIVFSMDQKAMCDFVLANGATESGEDIDLSAFKSPDPANVKNLPHARCAALHAADLVDDPAATDGMFSGAAGMSLAGQMTEYLDTHPEIFKAMNDEPELLNIVTRYADELKPFLSRYTENLAKKTAALAEPDKSNIAVCPKCGHEFDYTAQPEKGMGFVACPKCGADVTQEDLKPAEPGNKPEAPDPAEPDEGMQAKLDAAMTLAAAREKTIESLTGQVAGAERLHAQALESVKTQTERAEVAEAALKKAGEELTKANTDCAEAMRKLAAIEAGNPPASSEPVKEIVKKPARIFNTGK
jgi:ribosomal protein L37AE/L43A